MKKIHILLAILALCVVWFIYTIYRIGELGSGYEADDATLRQTEGIHDPSAGLPDGDGEPAES